MRMPTSEKDTSVTTVSAALVSALCKVLRPLVKLMLSKGITYVYLTDILKKIFVEVGDKDFRMNGKPVTDSHLSLLTGIHRKDIKRLRTTTNTKNEIVPETVSMGARLVSQWTSDPAYLDEDGHPKPLPRFIRDAGKISFEGLVASISKDIRSRVVLDEWLRLGVVDFDEQRRVCLKVEAFVPAKGFDEKAYYFGHNLHDHSAAAASNLIGEHQPFLERSVHYDALSHQSIRILAEQSELLGMQALLAINKKAMSLEQEDASKSEKAHRFTLGVYFYSEPVESEKYTTPTDPFTDEKLRNNHSPL
ncbi:hypothetical protein SAMN05216325_102154 [Nitrosomonas marina]|uniref:Uncharacterized protein n=2 Tax=Nitrosomonas marina TaxID=917 RepID=A0A1H8B8E4_9PROT|nr:hypothetical protein SAMN05216325_102154 [Nitrosomonas marina]